MAKLQIQIKPEMFDDFVDKLDELTKISDTLKIKIDKDNILLYSIVGDKILLAFKNFIIETDKYLSTKNVIEGTLDIVITSAKKFIKNIAFIKKTEKINMEVDFRDTEDDDIKIARFIQIKNGKLKISLQGGEPSEIRDINKDVLSKRVDIKNSTWSFKVNVSDFKDIKKLSSINSESKIINLSIDDNKVLLSESSVWELQVDENEESNKSLFFNKTFLPSINDQEDFVNFYIFDTFILTKTENSHLMISFEQDFESDLD